MAAAVLINSIFAVQLLSELFPVPHPTSATVRIGAGSLSFDPQKDGTGTGGDVPAITLFDVEGNMLSKRYPGIAFTAYDHAERVGDGNFTDLQLATQGSPEYIKLGYVFESDDPLCISYIEVTAPSGQDLFTWNGDYGKQCGMKWYPSELRFPGDNPDFRPACTWIGKHDATMPMGVSFKLTDFVFADSTAAEAVGRQWTAENDLICKAPGRMQFWRNITDEDCIPYYNRIPARNADGTDQNPLEIMQGHTMPVGCDPGSPWDNVLLAPSSPPPGDGGFGGLVGEIPNSARASPSSPSVSEAITVTSASNDEFGGSLGFVPLVVSTRTSTSASVSTRMNTPVNTSTNSPSSTPYTTTTSTSLRGGLLSTMYPASVTPDSNSVTPLMGCAPVATSSVFVTSKESSATPLFPSPTGIDVSAAQPDEAIVKNNKRRSMSERRHAWIQNRNPCVNMLTISEHSAHSAREVCQSETSWGADFVSMPEKLYCDMCTRHLWPVCDDYETVNDCFHVERRELLLREASKLLGRDNVQKRFEHVAHWR